MSQKDLSSRRGREGLRRPERAQDRLIGLLRRPETDGPSGRRPLRGEGEKLSVLLGTDLGIIPWAVNVKYIGCFQ